jgi:hypothetical protein
MTAEGVIERLKGAGLALVVGADGALSIRGTRANYTAELRAAVSEHRAALVQSLSAGSVNNLHAGDAGNAGDVSTLNAYAGEALSLSEEISRVKIGESPASPASPALLEFTPQGDPTPVAHTEIRTLPLALTRSLPLPCTVVVRFAGATGRSALTTSLEGRRRALVAQQAVWTVDEYEALALAVQEGRAGAKEVLAWDRDKRARGEWAIELTPRTLLGGADGLLTLRGRVPEGALTSTWGDFLDALGAELIDVICERVAGTAHRDMNPENVSEGDEVVL